MMNLLKKLAACGLSLTMILSLAACGGTDDTSSGESGGEPVKYLIGISQYGQHGSLDNCREGFLQGLEQAGLVEGTDFEVDYQNANFDDNQATQIGQMFSAEDADLMVGIATNSAIACFNAAEDKDIPVIFTAITTLFEVTISCMAGYALARMEFTGKKAITFSLLSLRLFPGVLLLIGALYVLMYLGVLNTLFGVIIVASALRLPGSTFIIRNFFTGIPRDIENSALVDGCNRMTAFFQVIIHMVKPGIASISMFAFMSAWSNYLLFNTLIFNTKTPVLATYLRALSRNDQMIADYGVFAAMALIYMLPVLIFFFISQKQLMEGTISGGKGI